MKLETVLATKPPIVLTIAPDETLGRALALLAEHDIGCLPVVEAPGRLVGMLSERDIVRAGALGAVDLEREVATLTTRDVVQGSPGDDVEALLAQMIAGRFRHLPIVDRGELVGVVTIGDVVKARLDSLRGEVETLQTQVMEGPEA